MGMPPESSVVRYTLMPQDDFVFFEDYAEDTPGLEREGEGSRSIDIDVKTGVGETLAMGCVLWPIAAGMIWWRGVMVGQLDRDLQWIVTRFCDTVILFAVCVPFCFLVQSRWTQRLADRLMMSVWRIGKFVMWLFIIAFWLGAAVSIFWIGSELYRMIF